MLKNAIPVIAILSALQAQDGLPFEIDIRSRIINESKLLVNVQVTNLVDRPLDYLEGFIREVNSQGELLDEKRMVILYSYEPPLQTGFSSTKSIAYPLPGEKPNSYEFHIAKLKFIGESRVFTWHPKIGFIRID